MTTDVLKRLLLRDLDALRRELMAYEREADLWTCPPGIENSAGTLALHAAGNIQHFLGTHLAGTEYVRDREREFTGRGIPRSELVQEIERAKDAARLALDAFSTARLDEPLPIDVGGVRPQTGTFLMHLAAHLAYHLGQVDYHRRLVTGQGATVGAQAVAELMDG
ncbi:MAG: DinB family protein [Gemmatimonadota bacterium]|nr:DinB family protein [Gemmatimonadota bacterium]MDH5196550.1 DinB family protein [Gemmatimonadota bacterium]